MTYRDTARRRQDVKDAVSGVAMTERDERLLDWLAATWDQDTTTALADLIARSRRALIGPVSADSVVSGRDVVVSID